MTKFLEIKSINPKLKQSGLAKDLGCSSSTLKRYRQDINLFSPCRHPSSANKRKQKVSYIKREPKRAQTSSNYPIVTEIV